VVFARTFTDDAGDVTTDDAWTEVIEGRSPFMQILSWSTDDDLRSKLLSSLVQELNLGGPDDEGGFALSLGGTVSNGWPYFNAAYSGRAGAAASS
jgi:hypothetical protein